MSVACMQCFFRAISETGFLEPVCYKFPSLGCMIYVGRNVCSHYDMLYSSMFGALFHYLSIRFISNTIPWKYWPLCTHRRASTLSPCWLCFTGCPTPNLRALLFSLQDALGFHVSLVTTFGYVFANKLGFTLFLLT